MEVFPLCPLLELSIEDIKKIRKEYDVDAKRINESVDAIEEWIKKQDHLVEASKYMDRNYLERMFMLSRASTETTKDKIEKVLTIRSLNPEICFISSAAEFDNLYNIARYVPLPKLNPKDLSRILVMQLVPENIEQLSSLEFFRYAFMLGEYRLHFDYSHGDTMVIDMKETSVVSKINLLHLKKSDSIATSYGIKIRGVHIINAPPFIDAFLRVAKQVISEKLQKRLHVHNSYDDLYEHIPREILPEDFGGELPTLDIMSARWKEYWKTDIAVKLIADGNHIKSDESKRISENHFNEDYMGMPGSFRKLVVD